MNEQPEALRLAAELEDEHYPWPRFPAAAELRRLSIENDALGLHLSERMKDLAAVEAQRDALLEVAHKYIAWSEAENDHKGTTFWERVEMCREVDELARAAIKAVEGEKG